MLESAERPLRLGTVPTVLAVVAAAAAVVGVIVLASRPLAVGDVWWHLALGQAFVEQGLWPAADPLVFTASPGAPAPSSWLFDVLVHGLDRVFGLQAVRGLHAVWVLAIVALLTGRLRVRTGGWLPAGLGVVVYAAVAVGSLLAMRDDLAGALLALLLVAWTVESEIPSPRNMGLALATLLVWINADALWAVGALLLFATLAGYALRWGLSQSAGLVLPYAAKTSNRRRAALLAAGLVLAIVSPGGLEGRAGVADLGPSLLGPSFVGLAALGLTVAFIGTSGLAFARFRTNATAAHLAALRCEELALSFVALALVLVYSRLAWLAAFPVSYVAVVGCGLLRERPRRAPLTAWALAAVAIALAGGFVWANDVPREILRSPATVARPYALRGTPVDTIRFLQQTQLEGRMFTSVELGGFFGYWLAPGLQVFLDGRLESSKAALRDAELIESRRGTHDRETFLMVLERYEVDVFVGTGLPVPDEPYNTLHLQDAPGWTLVHRTYDQAVYLRANPRNVENLARVQRHYAAQGIEVDVAQGLDLKDLVRRRVRWSMGNGLLPGRFLEVSERLANLPGHQRLRALRFLGLANTLAGDYVRGVATEQAILRLMPEVQAAHERLVFDLLQLGRGADALAAAQRYVEHSDTPRAQRFVEVAQHYRERELSTRPVAWDPGLGRITQALRIMAAPEARQRAELHYRKPPLLPPRF